MSRPARTGTDAGERVSIATARLFGSRAGEAHAALAAFGTEPHETAVERVRLAALKLSDGDLDALRRWVAQAKRDWRDVVAPAEYPEEDRMGAAAMAGLDAVRRWHLRRRDRRQYDAWLARVAGPRA